MSEVRPCLHFATMYLPKLQSVTPHTTLRISTIASNQRNEVPCRNKWSLHTNLERSDGITSAERGISNPTNKKFTIPENTLIIDTVRKKQKYKELR